MSMNNGLHFDGGKNGAFLGPTIKHEFGYNRFIFIRKNTMLLVVVLIQLITHVTVTNTLLYLSILI